MTRMQPMPTDKIREFQLHPCHPCAIIRETTCPEQSFKVSNRNLINQFGSNEVLHPFGNIGAGGRGPSDLQAYHRHRNRFS